MKSARGGVAETIECVPAPGGVTGVAAVVGLCELASGTALSEPIRQASSGARYWVRLQWAAGQLRVLLPPIARVTSSRKHNRVLVERSAGRRYVRCDPLGPGGSGGARFATGPDVEPPRWFVEGKAVRSPGRDGGECWSWRSSRLES